MIRDFGGVNRLFVLSFENDAYWRSYKRYFLPTVELEDYNNMIDQTVKKYYMKKFERLKLVKEIITQLVVCCITLIPKLLQDDSNKFKQTTSTRCWLESNTANQFYYKYRLSRTSDNVFYLKKQKKPF